MHGLPHRPRPVFFFLAERNAGAQLERVSRFLTLAHSPRLADAARVPGGAATLLAMPLKGHDRPDVEPAWEGHEGIRRALGFFLRGVQGGALSMVGLSAKPARTGGAEVGVCERAVPWRLTIADGQDHRLRHELRRRQRAVVVPDSPMGKVVLTSGSMPSELKAIYIPVEKLRAAGYKVDAWLEGKALASNTTAVTLFLPADARIHRSWMPKDARGGRSIQNVITAGGRVPGTVNPWNSVDAEALMVFDESLVAGGTRWMHTNVGPHLSALVNMRELEAALKSEGVVVQRASVREGIVPSRAARTE